MCSALMPHEAHVSQMLRNRVSDLGPGEFSRGTLFHVAELLRNLMQVSFACPVAPRGQNWSSQRASGRTIFTMPPSYRGFLPEKQFDLRSCEFAGQAEVQAESIRHVFASSAMFEPFCNIDE